MQDDGGQMRSVTEMHADTVEFLDGRRDWSADAWSNSVLKYGNVSRRIG